MSLLRISANFDDYFGPLRVAFGCERLCPFIFADALVGTTAADDLPTSFAFATRLVGSSAYGVCSVYPTRRRALARASSSSSF